MSPINATKTATHARRRAPPRKVGPFDIVPGEALAEDTRFESVSCLCSPTTHRIRPSGWNGRRQSGTPISAWMAPLSALTASPRPQWRGSVVVRKTRGTRKHHGENVQVISASGRLAAAGLHGSPGPARCHLRPRPRTCQRRSAMPWMQGSPTGCPCRTRLDREAQCHSSGLRAAATNPSPVVTVRSGCPTRRATFSRSN